jgi:hypothetical protein
MMASEAQQVIDTPRLEFGVWWGVAAGPLAWGVDLGSSYAVTQHACSTGHYYVLHVISVICFVLALTGFVLAFGMHRRLPQNADKQGHSSRDRAFFMSLVGIVMSLFFAVIIIAGAVPRWILSPCS